MMINNGKNVVAISLKELKSQLRKLATQKQELSLSVKERMVNLLLLQH